MLKVTAVPWGAAWSEGWTVIFGAAGVTLRVAEPLVTLPPGLVTTH